MRVIPHLVVKLVMVIVMVAAPEVVELDFGVVKMWELGVLHVGIIHPKLLPDEFLNLFDLSRERLEIEHQYLLEEYLKPILEAGVEEMPLIFRDAMLFRWECVVLLANFSLTKLHVRMSSLLRKTAKLYEEICESYIKHIKDKCEEKGIPSEDVKSAALQLFDYDLWLLGKVTELGMNEFLKALLTYASDEIKHMSAYLIALSLTLMAIDAGVSEWVPCNVENLKILVSWAKHYAKELDSYLDTVDLLITNECREVLEEFLKAEEK